MSTAAQMTVKARSAASALFEREHRRTGSRMAAYENVAAMVGASAGWIRKFINENHEVKQPDWTIGWNILAVYERICERVEARADALERANAATDKGAVPLAERGHPVLVAAPEVPMEKAGEG